MPPRPWSRAQLVLCVVFLSAILAAQEKSPEPVPMAGAEVTRLLDAAGVAAAAGHFDNALGEADRALTVAQEGRDAIGLAMAERARAEYLSRLARRDAALAAWRSAEDAWKQAADGPGQMQAIFGQAAILLAQNPAETQSLVTRAIDMGRAERVRPRAALGALIQAGPQLVTRAPKEAQRVFETVRSIEEGSGRESIDLASALNGLGALAGNAGDRATSRQYHERALAIRERLAPNSVGLAGNLNSLALLWLNDRQREKAREYYRRALAVGEAIAPVPGTVAVSLTGLGDLATNDDDLETALACYQRALGVRETLAPGSPAVADSLHDIGQVSAARGDLLAAREYYDRSLAIYEQLAPDSLESTRVLNSLGVLSRRQGDVDAAIRYYERALRIREKLTPNSSGVATMLNNLGFAAREKGDLGAAREYLERSLAILQGTSSSLQLASALNNLGLVAKGQGDRSAAREYFERAIDIEQRVAPDGNIVANYISNLANLAADEGDLATARTQHLRVLAIRTKVAAKSNDVGVSLNNLMALEIHAGDLAAAREYGARALAMWTEVAPRSLAQADCLDSLGNIARAEGDAAAARNYYLQALAIQALRAPNALATIGSLQALADVSMVEKNLAAALDYATRAWSLVRAQAALVAGDEARQAFAAAYHSFATQTVRIQIAAGRTEAAFATLEESRAQALLQIIAGRGVARRLTAPETLKRYDRAQSDANRAGLALARAGGTEADARTALELEVTQLSAAAVVDEKRRILADAHDKAVDADRAYTRARIEAEARWADLLRSLEPAIPAPLSLAEARLTLPANTLLAAFAVGDEASVLFLVAGDGRLDAFDLPLGAREIEARTNLLRRAIDVDPATRGLTPVMPDTLRIQASRDLFQKLFPPAAREAIARANRLVLSPDGVLWDLPFAALVTNENGTASYLGLQKPLSYTQSLTTLAQRARRPASAATEVLIVGNPLYERAATSSRAATSRAAGELASMSATGAAPRPLPFAEQEAKQIAALYKTHASVGAEPTEAWVRERIDRARVVHLATHGYFNPTRAVSSGVWLAVPARDSGTSDDGTLQAWEVLTELRLQAEVVVLSACETGVGAKVPGEGLVGLTRAFQVAGAASVVATQWKVADRSSSQAMVEFHRALVGGKTRGDALFQALRAVAAERATDHPYHWAGFMLVGDFGLLR